MEDEEPEDWLFASKRRGALRLLVIGIALLAAGLAWALTYWGWAATSSPITYVRVVSVLVLGIGTGLTIAGIVMLRRLRLPGLARAKVVDRS